MYADAHAHLSMPDFDEDRDEVLARAARAGVTSVMSCATSLSDAARNIAVTRASGEVRVLASVGFHPHQASQWDDGSESALRELIASSPEVVAIGEVGLDYHYNFSPPEVQRDVLRRQAALARSVGLPLVIHCRNAREDMTRLLDGDDAREAGGVLHCFSEDADFARHCLDRGFYISFSGILTFRNAGEIRDAAAIVPLDRILVETDAPYLAPVPHRGRRNEPAHVVEVARHLAALRRVPVERLAEATLGNFNRLFGRTAPAAS